ncbi:unnamed protein product [Arctogadus glacialis]
MLVGVVGSVVVVVGVVGVVGSVVVVVVGVLVLVGVVGINNNTIAHRVNHIDIMDRHLTLKSFHPCAAPHQMFSLSPCQ